MTIPKKKRKKPLTATPVHRIAAALRQIWMWSPERRQAVKRAGKKCEECDCEVVETKKQQETTGKKRLEVHHQIPCNMTELAKYVHNRMFPGDDNLIVLCQDCHKDADEHIKRRGE